MGSSDSKKDILRRVKEVREEAGWPDSVHGKLSEFAEKKMGLDTNYYKTYETRSLMKPETLALFCEITGAKPEYILFGWLPKWKAEDLNRIYDHIVPNNRDLFKDTISAFQKKSHPES